MFASNIPTMATRREQFNKMNRRLKWKFCVNSKSISDGIRIKIFFRNVLNLGHYILDLHNLKVR